jgi:hypothetical protein
VTSLEEGGEQGRLNRFIAKLDFVESDHLQFVEKLLRLP